MPDVQNLLTVYSHVEGCAAESRPMWVIDALHLLPRGWIHLQKISKICVAYLHAPHRCHNSWSGNEENVKTI